jgi:hypothetical protein
VTVWSEHERLRHSVLSIHEHAGGLSISPTNAKAKMKVARELLNFIASRDGIFGGQSDEFNLFAGELSFRTFS